jgi:hypothetical protein
MHNTVEISDAFRNIGFIIPYGGNSYCHLMGIATVSGRGFELTDLAIQRLTLYQLSYPDKTKIQL